MNHIRLIGVATAVLVAAVGGSAQQIARDAAPPAPQVTQLRPTHPPEPVIPVTPGTSVGEAAIPINPTGPYTGSISKVLIYSSLL